MSPQTCSPRRMMIPVNANDDSRWGVQHALQCQRRGEAVEAVLLHVAEPVDAWQVLRCLTRAEVAACQAARASAFIESAAEPLRAANIPCRSVFKQGATVQTILATATELDCAEIVVPPPHAGWQRLFSRDYVSLLRAHARQATMVIVDAAGQPTNIT